MNKEFAIHRNNPFISSRSGENREKNTVFIEVLCEEVGIRSRRKEVNDRCEERLTGQM